MLVLGKRTVMNAWASFPGEALGGGPHSERRTRRPRGGRRSTLWRGGEGGEKGNEDTGGGGGVGGGVGLRRGWSGRRGRGVEGRADPRADP